MARKSMTAVACNLSDEGQTAWVRCGLLTAQIFSML
jgi:hypothetical protein